MLLWSTVITHTVWNVGEYHNTNFLVPRPAPISIKPSTAP